MKTTLSIILILILSTAFTSPDLSRIIEGKVTDESGSPIPGVAVMVKGTSRGVSTDINGIYRIEVEPADRVLVFRFIGMVPVETQIGTNSIIDVVMTADLMSLDEVIVTGISREEKLSGTVAGVATTRSKTLRKSEYYNNAPAMGYDRRYNAQEFNTEGYSTIHENGFRKVLDNPLSTFSVDVDRASYSNIRRFINQGTRPPVDAVRIEEMVNYFKYDYPEPDGEHPFSVFTEASECPWNKEHYLLHIGLKGKSIEKEGLPASNLVFLLDVSGSMDSPNKLPLLKSAFTMLVNELRPQDRVSIVVYAGAAGMVLEPTPGNRKEKILGAINRLNAGGSTAGGEGLMLAYRLAEENFIDGGNNRIILATDGDFNVGVSSNAEMERLVEKKRDKGIYITVLGFGMGNYKDDKMEIIADKGNGNYAYIDNLLEARKVLVSEFGGTLFTIAKDVKFQIEFNPARVESYRLVGYENRLLNDEDFNDDTKDAGEMGSGHTVTAIYELVPAGKGYGTSSVDPLKYQPARRTVAEDYSEELLTVKLRYKKPGGSKSILMVQPYAGRIRAIEEASDNLRFSAAVAGFGMLLRDSENSGNFTLERVIELAASSRGKDEEGYRSEFIRLAGTVKSMNMIGGTAEKRWHRGEMKQE
ncbi:MAG: von Willebrand factor type A domain-containing protein [Bacteroidales bacterium]